ncbi:HNH endonuclease [Rhizobium leguminosarum]|uniref:HNH endonuclease n=1 Tax=Rhizobium leguminosarum TaxID=384 RepID=UPI001C9878E9|nr:HNH endonuclease [Rhizobium leguminosarum]MBY5400952.1 HNH endonuclease [Rhizobium leguminosarum]
MHYIARPEIDDDAVFLNCVQFKMRPLKDRFHKAQGALQQASATYVEKALTGRLVEVHTIVNGNDFDVSGDELRLLYDNQLAKKTAKQRDTYDYLRLRARRCPFCSHRTPETLDHYLPRESFAEFSIFSANLVPCCRDCNGVKHTRVLSEDEQLIHPYFDNISEYPWLECALAFVDNAPIYDFYVSQNAGLPDELMRKARFHMGALNLSELYAVEAVDEVAGMTVHVKSVYSALDAQGVKDHLADLAASKSAYNRNTWTSALYRSLASNDRFCQMDWSV